MKKILLASTLTSLFMTSAMADIKVGILHSLSGTMAISETTLKDTMLMLIDQQNRKTVVLNGEKNYTRCGRPSFRLAIICRKKLENY